MSKKYRFHQKFIFTNVEKLNFVILSPFGHIMDTFDKPES